ncbi:hypothetical protein VTO42DRAFT_2036 [Malbranchea cinnamomea]
MSPSAQNSQLAQIQCQFSGETCSTESTHFRKVISHIFGRNKKCTIGIPDYVWIYYCRKHYQRARYRTGEWPFRQCDLAMDTIRNMREWGGVESFDLQLRRREARRTSGRDDRLVSQGSQGPDVPATSSLFLPGNGASTPGAPLFPTAENGDHTACEDNTIDTFNSNISGSGKKKKPPTIVPRPVPDWLRACVGTKKSFSEILRILRELRIYMTRMAERGETPHFPDIEILPNFKPRAAAERSKGSSRVSRKGAVQKPTKGN